MVEGVRVYVFILRLTLPGNWLEEFFLGPFQKSKPQPVPPGFPDVAIATIHANSTNHREFGATNNRSFPRLQPIPAIPCARLCISM